VNAVWNQELALRIDGSHARNHPCKGGPFRGAKLYSKSSRDTATTLAEQLPASLLPFVHGAQRRTHNCNASRSDEPGAHPEATA
jgi:hypothetical protein